MLCLRSRSSSIFSSPRDGSDFILSSDSALLLSPIPCWSTTLGNWWGHTDRKSYIEGLIAFESRIVKGKLPIEIATGLCRGYILRKDQQLVWFMVCFLGRFLPHELETPFNRLCCKK